MTLIFAIICVMVVLFCFNDVWIRPVTKVFYDLDTKVESATGRGIEGKTDVCI